MVFTLVSLMIYKNSISEPVQYYHSRIKKDLLMIHSKTGGYTNINIRDTLNKSLKRIIGFTAIIDMSVK